jgi:hypothetical protein
MRDKKERKAKERNGMIMLERRRVRLETVTQPRRKLQRRQNRMNLALGLNLQYYLHQLHYLAYLYQLLSPVFLYLLPYLVHLYQLPGRALDALPEHYEAELEINDFPQNARWRITHVQGYLGPNIRLDGCCYYYNYKGSVLSTW